MKVVICGAGIAGLALANRLAALGHEVVVLERTPGPRPQGYMIDFFGPGYDAVEAMGCCLPCGRSPITSRRRPCSTSEAAGEPGSTLPSSR